MPNVFRTLVSSLPVIMGYTFLGLALFWKSNRFESAAGCLTTLYALMCGDMVYDTFYDLSQTNLFLSQLYLYSFVFFSICVVNSLFISVIEDAYITAKYTSQVDTFFGRGEGKVPLKKIMGKRYVEIEKEAESAQVEFSLADVTSKRSR